VFSLTLSGNLTTLHSFDFTDGSFPIALIQASDGNFYGTTFEGGANLAGTVFKMTPSGAFTILYNFCSLPGCPDGVTPATGLVQATDGNFYGTTTLGGNYNGTIFQITPSGKLTTVHAFNGSDGCDPRGALVQHTDGKLYGTTFTGGTVCGFGDGTAFSLDMGLAPFVTFVLNSAKTGQAAQILGQGLTGTTTVLFNGVSAGFTVMSDTFLVASVPTGATTGYVTVTTPSGTLTSNVQFHVLP